MKKSLRISLFIFLFTTAATTLIAQGEVGIGTTSPIEKLDVNGAMVVRGNAAMITPVPGTIKYNSLTGYHDGYVSAGYWRAIENYNQYLLNGDYTSLACGDTATVNIGAITGTSTGANETPFSTQFQDKKAQYLYKASELLAWGMCAGDITHVAWGIISIGSPSAINGFYIKMKLTTTTDLIGTAWETGATTVYGPVSFSMVVGLNTFTLATPFAWDGASNLIVEICYDNASGVSNTTVDWTSPVGFNGTRYSQTTAVGGGCFIAAATGVSTARPVIYLTGNTAGPITGIDDYIYYDKGIVVGDPALPAPYLHHGPGSLTAQAVFDENIQISDYVFDQYFDGTSPDLPKDNSYAFKPLPEMIEFMSINRHLPTMTGRKEWITKGTSSVGEIATELWVTYETHALYIMEMHQKIAAMELILNTAIDPLVSAYKEEITFIESDANLNTAEKQERINELLQLIYSIQFK